MTATSPAPDRATVTPGARVYSFFDQRREVYKKLVVDAAGKQLLGAVLGTVAVIVRQELVLVIMGGVFVVETLSVIIQVASFKLTGKRVFRMAPLHHHYELKGWKENQVVVRFWIVTMLLCLIGLASLKLR